LFGVGVMQVLATAPGGIADQFPKDMKRLYRLISRLWNRPQAVVPGPAGTGSAGASAGPAGKGGTAA
jgi:hypothetical protein